MKMRKHRIKGVEYTLPKILRIDNPAKNWVIAGNGYHRKTFDWENF